VIYSNVDSVFGGFEGLFISFFDHLFLSFY